MTEFELTTKENLDVALLFTETDGLKKKLKEIETEVLSIVPDTSTAKGRKEIASLAFKVAKSKVALDSLGKDLVADLKIRSSKIDISRKFARDFLDNLKDRVRQPLTDWEEKEDLRVQREAEYKKYESDWNYAHKDHELFLRVKELERKEAELEAMKAAQLAKEKAEREAEDARQAKIARKQQADIDAEAKRIADLATAHAMFLAEKKAIADAEAKTRIEAEQKQIADIQAEKDRADAQLKALIEIQEKKDHEASELKAKELVRIAAEKAEEEKRQKNVAHQKKVNNESLNALVAIDINLADAKRIIKAIIKGQIANVFIKY